MNTRRKQGSSAVLSGTIPLKGLQSVRRLGTLRETAWSKGEKFMNWLGKNFWFILLGGLILLFVVFMGAKVFG